jgi:hypothetical protein
MGAAPGATGEVPGDETPISLTLPERICSFSVSDVVVSKISTSLVKIASVVGAWPR